MIDLPENKKLILFDGVCNLCNSTVRYVIKHDKKDMFRFASLQSELGHGILKKYRIDASKTDSIMLYAMDHGFKIKSTAALFIAKDLDYPIKMMFLFIIIPRFIRNWVYDIIAKNRYKWYGKRESCMIPTPDLQAKFL